MAIGSLNLTKRLFWCLESEFKVMSSKVRLDKRGTLNSLQSNKTS